jgi:hypothetical protein
VAWLTRHGTVERIGGVLALVAVAFLLLRGPARMVALIAAAVIAVTAVIERRRRR